jgi:hypothetical protein
MSYSWSITYADLQDEPIKALGAAYFLTRPDPSKNYYDLTDIATINFAQSFGIDTTQLNGLNRTDKPPHTMIIDWMVLKFYTFVCQNNVGVNNDPLVDDKYRWKYKSYLDQLKSLSQKISYEMFLTAAMQQTFTRSGGVGQLAPS